MINEYSLLWRRLVTLAASCWGRWRGPHSPHCSGVKPIGSVHKFHHIAEQNVIGSARIVCLCLTMTVKQFRRRSLIMLYFVKSIIAFKPVTPVLELSFREQEQKHTRNEITFIYCFIYFALH